MIKHFCYLNTLKHSDLFCQKSCLQENKVDTQQTCFHRFVTFFHFKDLNFYNKYIKHSFINSCFTHAKHQSETVDFTSIENCGKTFNLLLPLLENRNLYWTYWLQRITAYWEFIAFIDYINKFKLPWWFPLEWLEKWERWKSDFTSFVEEDKIN